MKMKILIGKGKRLSIEKENHRGFLKKMQNKIIIEFVRRRREH